MPAESVSELLLCKRLWLSVMALDEVKSKKGRNDVRKAVKTQVRPLLGDTFLDGIRCKVMKIELDQLF